MSQLQELLQQLSLLIEKLGDATITLSRRLFAYLRTVDYTSKRFLYSAGGVVALLVVTFIGFKILFPTVVLEAGDFGPFESQEEFDTFVDQNSLLTAEQPSDQQFTISSQIRKDKQAIYTIQLTTRPIKPDMSEAYKLSYLEFLENSQKKALDWIRSQGQNPDELAIIWRPNPEEMRGRLLGESTKPIKQNGNTPASSPATTPSPSLTPTPTPSPTPTSSVTPLPTSSPVPTPAGRFPQ